MLLQLRNLSRRLELESHIVRVPDLQTYSCAYSRTSERSGMLRTAEDNKRLYSQALCSVYWIIPDRSGAILAEREAFLRPTLASVAAR